MAAFTEILDLIPADAPALTIPVGIAEHNGELATMDLATAPHMLYAGATGSGKSVGLNSAIATIMSRNTPELVRFTMIDPKRVELSMYRRSAFVDEVITDMDRANDVLAAVVDEMEARYIKLERAGVKNLEAYNADHDDVMIPRVLVVDELGDLMDTHSKTVLPALIRLGQLARAAGIHMMLATQRPAADTTPKRLVANVPTRFGFMCQSATESRIVLGVKGAEDLPGKGALLASIPGEKGLVRAQGVFLSDDEIAEVIAEHPAAPAPEVAVVAAAQTPVRVAESVEVIDDDDEDTEADDDVEIDDAAYAAYCAELDAKLDADGWIPAEPDDGDDGDDDDDEAATAALVTAAVAEATAAMAAQLAEVTAQLAALAEAITPAPVAVSVPVAITAEPFGPELPDYTILPGRVVPVEAGFVSAPMAPVVIERTIEPEPIVETVVVTDYSATLEWVILTVILSCLVAVIGLLFHPIAAVFAPILAGVIIGATIKKEKHGKEQVRSRDTSRHR